MIFTVHPDLPLKISTVAIELSDILLSTAFHLRLQETKGSIYKSNIEGPTLSREILRVFSVNTINLVPFSYPWYRPFSSRRVTALVDDPTTIKLNYDLLEVKDDLDYARSIGHATVSILDLLSPFRYGDGQSDPTTDGLTVPFVVSSLCAEIYKARRDQRYLLACRCGLNQEFLESIGATNPYMELKLKREVAKGVLSYGEFRQVREGSLHVID